MLTLADLMTHLVVQTGSPLAGFHEAKVRTAVMDAWNRLFCVKTDWKWFHRLGFLQIYAAQTTGTIAFDLATRTVTLTDATFPSDAEDMHIRLGNAWYPIYRRTSSTTVTMYPDQHPAEDLAAGTTYHLQQIIYPLPVEVGPIVQMVNPSQNLTMLQLNLMETLELSEAFGSFTQPTTYSLISDPKHPDRWCVWVPSVFTEDDVLHYLYVQRRPARLVFREDRGLVSLSSGVATFSDAICKSSWEGCVLRVSENDEAPTGNWGTVPVADVEYNSMDMQEMKVTEYLTTTTVRVSNTTSTLTSAPFVLSSHVDVKPGSMETLMQRLAEDEYGMRPVSNHMEGITSQRRVRQALAEAATEDALGFRTVSPLLPFWYRSLSDLAGSVS